MSASHVVRTFAAAAALAGWACAPGAVAAQEPVVLKFASFTSAKGDLNADAIPDFISKVEEASEGTLKFEFYPGGVLGGSPAVQLKLVQDGVADIAQVVASYTPGRFPDMALFELPFLAENNVEGSVAAWRMHEAGLLRGFDDVHMIGFLESGPYGLHGTFPIEAVDSVEGRKIRAAGPVQGRIVSQLGGVPVGNVTAPQIAESVSRGLVDGTLMSVASLYAFRIADVADQHMTAVPMGSVSVLFPMNKEKYESLPPKAKAALDMYAGEWFSRRAGEAQDAAQTRYMAQMAADPTHHVHEVSAEEMEAWRAALAGVEDEWNRPNEDGVNLFQEVNAILNDLRAGE